MASAVETTVGPVEPPVPPHKTGAPPMAGVGLSWRTLPSALTLEKPSERRLVVFLDYDGTLTPIVSDPSAATLSSTMRDAVRRLANKAPVAVVSGRAREKIHEFVALSDLYYAGSHGFDIDGPGGMRHSAVSTHILPLLGRTQDALHERLRGIDGVSIEDNRFAVTVHWRNVLEHSDRLRVEQIVDEILASPPYEGHLRKSHGKCVYELRPKVDWDKGKAVVYLLELLRRARNAARREHSTAADKNNNNSRPTSVSASVSAPDANTDEDTDDARSSGALPREPSRTSAEQFAADDADPNAVLGNSPVVSSDDADPNAALGNSGNSPVVSSSSSSEGTHNTPHATQPARGEDPEKSLDHPDSSPLCSGTRPLLGKQSEERRGVQSEREDWSSSSTTPDATPADDLDDPTVKNAWYDSILPVYIGDDTTDEDAFGALAPLGGVCVLNVADTDEAQRPQLTRATHVLRGVHDVETFLNFLAEA